MLSASKLKKVVVAGAAALTIGGATLAASTPAEAQWGYGYRYRPYYGRYYRPNYGGAVAAGLVGGLALGALAASAPRPAYYYDEPVYGGACYVTRQRFVDPYGRLVVRRTRVCE